MKNGINIFLNEFIYKYSMPAPRSDLPTYMPWTIFDILVIYGQLVLANARMLFGTHFCQWVSILILRKYVQWCTRHYVHDYKLFILHVIETYNIIDSILTAQSVMGDHMSEPMTLLPGQNLKSRSEE